MKKFILLPILIAALIFPTVGSTADILLDESPTTICFSPVGNCTERIVREIALAKSEVLVMAYSFTSTPIAKALIDAKKRGVNIEIVIDKGRKTERYSAITFFENQGIPVYVDGKEPIQHNKIMIIDNATVITGSFNFTKRAEKNAENVLIIKSTELAGIYKDNWLIHRRHSRQIGQQKGGLFND